NMLRIGGYTDYQLGESRIMELVNFDMLDAVILVPDSLQMQPEYAEEIAKQIRQNFNGVCVSIDMAVEGFWVFACDDAAGVREVVEHLIEVHGCTDIAFMTGPKEHPHSGNRLLGYRQAMEHAGLEVDETRIFYGDFWYDEGERVVEELMASERGLPQAIACGSDTMAVSVCYALQKWEIRVPEDVLVTGYDCEPLEGEEKAFITSATRGVALAAAKAVRYIAGTLGVGGRSQPLRKKSDLMLYQSCSCGRRFRFDKILPDKREDEFFAIYNFMQECLIMAKDLVDCLWEIDGYALHAGKFDRMYLCLSPDWEKRDGQEQEVFTDRMMLALDTVGPFEKKKEGRVRLDRIFDAKDMLPAYRADREKPAMFYFNMLHFGSHCFGYIVLEYHSSECVFGKRYPFWVRKVNVALESLRRVYAVNDLYKAAQHKAVTDAMTGLYNRNGYNILLPDILQGMEEGEQLFFMLCDNNGLKYINDTFGHLAGDDVICLSTRILLRTSIKGALREYNFRVGGDEYVKLAVGHFCTEGIGECVSSIRAQTQKINDSKERDYPLHLAIGYQVYKKEEISSIDQVMTEVDALMYQDKQRIKKTSGFNPLRKE
ncbi:MAG: GGDEF domain-containing protein, partial [Lachnospiraceae bacterium]|nr:GGDEF domain-containing protein [Lachnospiraceae bacterium]